jgi:hypothetical protein
LTAATLPETPRHTHAHEAGKSDRSSGGTDEASGAGGTEAEAEDTASSARFMAKINEITSDKFVASHGLTTTPAASSSTTIILHFLIKN